MSYYYGIIYYDTGGCQVSKPYESLDKLMNDIKDGVIKHAHRVIGTSYITRKEKLTVQQILGCPKSRDVMRDKKFLKELRG